MWSGAPLRRNLSSPGGEIRAATGLQGRAASALPSRSSLNLELFVGDAWHRSKSLFLAITFVLANVSASLPPPGSNALSLSTCTAARHASAQRAAFPDVAAGSAA